jgi:hypothetical protein
MGAGILTMNKSKRYTHGPTRCDCHPETCCCQDWAVYNPEGRKHSTYNSEESAAAMAEILSPSDTVDVLNQARDLISTDRWNPISVSGPIDDDLMKAQHKAFFKQMVELAKQYDYPLFYGHGSYNPPTERYKSVDLMIIRVDDWTKGELTVNVIKQRQPDPAHKQYTINLEHDPKKFGIIIGGNPATPADQMTEQIQFILDRDGQR